MEKCVLQVGPAIFNQAHLGLLCRMYCITKVVWQQTN
jgi:hypothetical protein